MEQTLNVFRRRLTTSSRTQSAAERYEVVHQEYETLQNQQFEDQIVQEDNNGEEDALDSNDDCEILKESFPGGPNNPVLLPSFKTHVAAAIWAGREREVLRCHCLTSKLLKWKCDTSSQRWKALIKRSGLLNLRKFSYWGPNRNLITAFIERWHPETNSFHLPFGEMTITLDDVFCITGLSVTGTPVQFIGEEIQLGHSVVRRLLGVSDRESNDAVSDKSGLSIKLSWLLTKFASTTSSDDDIVALNGARAYLLYTLGCTIFVDKSGDRVSTHLLRLFEDPKVFGNYAWGAAALAFLYRQMGMASRVGIKQISGYLTLLEAWIYEHFPTLGRPQLNVQYRDGEPLAGRWTHQTHPAGSEAGVKAYRAMLDQLRPEEVLWDPYQQFRESSKRPEVTFYEGCITAGDIIEPYLPDRVLRQFGLVQTIPRAPLRPLKWRRGRKPGQYKLTWGIVEQLFEEWRSHKLSADRRGRMARPATMCVPEYITWYKSCSHPFLQNPMRTSVKHVEHHTSNPWDGYQVAADYLRPVISRWKDGDANMTLEIMMPHVEQAFEYLMLQARYHGHYDDISSRRFE